SPAIVSLSLHDALPILPLDIGVEHRGEFAGHVGFEFEQDDAPAAAAADRGAEEADQILGLFLELDVAVADDAKHPARPDAKTGRSEEHTSELQSREKLV